MGVVDSFLAAAVEVILALLDLYVWVIIIGALLSWLAAFDVLNLRSRFVQVVGDLCFRITEPVLRHIRRFVPNVNGIDLSPLALIFIIMFLQHFLARLVTRI